MNIEIEHKTTATINAHFDGNLLKSHDCDLGEWYGSDICERVDLTREIEEAGLPKGDYKITILFEKI